LSIGIVLSLVSAAAYAQGSVTLYGIVDTAIELADSGANRAFYDAGPDAGSATRLISGKPGNSKGSRLGLRGAEELGGGLRAIFAIEHRYNLTPAIRRTRRSGTGRRGSAWTVDGVGCPRAASTRRCSTR
jgi:predicted porin